MLYNLQMLVQQITSKQDEFLYIFALKIQPILSDILCAHVCADSVIAGHGYEKRVKSKTGPGCRDFKTFHLSSKGLLRFLAV